MYRGFYSSVAKNHACQIYMHVSARHESENLEGRVDGLVAVKTERTRRGCHCAWHVGESTVHRCKKPVRKHRFQGLECQLRTLANKLKYPRDCAVLWSLPEIPEAKQPPNVPASFSAVHP